MEVSLADKVPPQNIEAEQAVLGALLLDWDAMANVVSFLRPDRFYSLQNQLIFDAMLKLYTKNIRGDSVSLANELTQMGKLEQAGGSAYIASLTDTVPSSANIESYADIVLDRAARRDLISVFSTSPSGRCLPASRASTSSSSATVRCATDVPPRIPTARVTPTAS